MRAISMPSLFTKYEKPNLYVTKKLLPDVKTIDIFFKKLTSKNAFEPHLAEECSIEFRNGRVLNIPGYMLWKFLDCIPEGLGDEESGYYDHNMFTSQHGEALMKSIRVAYDQFFSYSSSNGLLKPPPRMVRMDLDKFLVSELWLTEISDESKTFIKSSFIDYLDDCGDILRSISSFVKSETSRQEYSLGWKNFGNGMIGREVHRQDWPDLKSLRFEDFLKCMSEQTLDNCPAHKSQMDLFSEVIDLAADHISMKFFGSIRNSPGYARLSKELGCSTKNPLPQNLLKKMANSSSQFILHNVLWSHMFKQTKDKTVAEIISY